jgi:glycosyltransferase involved in cell wall biosynthesis
MRRMLDDEPLRRRFIEAGRRRSASLGWGRVAGAVDALYNSLDTTPSS